MSPRGDCRDWPREAADGPANMALDEAMLEHAAEDGTATFRTYEWSVPTLSLGYFQRLDEAAADPRLRGVPVVRRPTGGGAIWHHHEITYALALPRSHPLAGRAGALYEAVHEAIAAALRAAGVPARRRGAGGVAENRRDRPFLCFTGRDPADIVIGAAKVVGGAQRRRSGAILQHGSLILRHSERLPELPGLGDLAAVSAEPSLWDEHLRERVLGAIGLRPRPGAPSPADRDRAAAIERRVYRDPAWTGRR
ncbi:MAG TPA: lipoate--protein ligase [Isosphaeraceae bacterium]|jgi:lipoate-protein ligase A|nr:lipoate--protein ligase [Isosphaeraceae bacterium]